MQKSKKPIRMCLLLFGVGLYLFNVSCSVNDPEVDSVFVPYSNPDIYMETGVSPSGNVAIGEDGLLILPGVDIFPLRNDSGEQVRLSWYDSSSRPPFPWQAAVPKVPSTMEDHIGGGNFEPNTADMGGTIQMIESLDSRDTKLRYQPVQASQGTYGADWFRYATTTIAGIESVSHVHVRWSELEPDVYEPDDHPQFARDMTRLLTRPKGRTVYESHTSDYKAPFTPLFHQRFDCLNNTPPNYLGDFNAGFMNGGDRDWFKIIVPDNKSILTIESIIPNEKGSSDISIDAGQVSITLFDGSTGAPLVTWFPPPINSTYNMGGNNQHAAQAGIGYGFSRWRAPVDNDKRHQTSGGITTLANVNQGTNQPGADPGTTVSEDFNNRAVRLRWPLDTGYNNGLLGAGAEVFIRVTPMGWDNCLSYYPLGSYRIAMTLDDRPVDYYEVPLP